MRNFFGGIYAVFVRELSRIRHSITYVAMLFVLPFIAILFFAVFFEKGVAESLPIAVLDEDNTDLSRRLVHMVNDTPAAKVAYGIQGMTEGITLIREGRVYAVLQIPSRFEKNIMGGGQAHVELYNSGTNISVNSLLAKDVQTAVTTFSVGVQLNLMQSRGLSARQAMAQAQPIRFSKHVLFNPYVNYGYYVAPCFMAMMLMIFTILSTIYATGSELKNSTAGEWYSTGHGSMAAAIIGKMLPITIVMGIVAVAMFVIIFNIMGAPMNGSPWLLGLATAVFIISYQCIGLFVLALTDNMRLALSFGGGYSVLAFTFSGLTFPTMAMAPVLQWFGCLFPFTFYMRVFIDQVLRGAPVGVSVSDVGFMVLFWMLPVLTINLFRRECTDKKYWGKL